MIDIQSQNDERRFSFDRRQFHYSMHIPERRSGIERRNIADRFKNAKSMKTASDLKFGNRSMLFSPALCT